YNGHSQGHMAMLSGKTAMPPGFDPNSPRPSDWPSIGAIANQVTTPRHNLPPAVILPFSLIHRTGRVIPGQFAGEMGQHWDPWVISAARDCGSGAPAYGACPTLCFHHERTPHTHPADNVFQAPNLSLPQGLTPQQLANRVNLLAELDAQRENWEQEAVTGQ